MKKHFIRKRIFRNSAGERIKQFWLYVLNNNGSFEPIVGTYEPKYSEAKKILLNEI